MATPVFACGIKLASNIQNGWLGLPYLWPTALPEQRTTLATFVSNDVYLTGCGLDAGMVLDDMITACSYFIS